MAATITEATGLPVQLVSGARGEFSVRVDGATVAQKSPEGFPSPEAVVAAVQRTLAGGG